MLNQEEIKRAFDQAMDIWIKPEIERRKKKGWLKGDFKFSRAQIIFTPKKLPRIKFNKEVVVKAKARAKRKILKGEQVTTSDISSIEEIIVDCPPNSGHITLIFFLDRWVVAFDSRYNKKKIKEFIKASREFYESAKDNLEKKRLRPFFENCWATAELCSACHFLSLGQDYGKHDENLENFKKWSELGNVDKKHSDTLNKLNHLRKSARYLYTSEFKKENPEIYLQAIEEMIKDTNKLIGY